jgi:hypothetical protein
MIFKDCLRVLLLTKTLSLYVVRFYRSNWIKSLRRTGAEKINRWQEKNANLLERNRDRPLGQEK